MLVRVWVFICAVLGAFWGAQGTLPSSTSGVKGRWVVSGSSCRARRERWCRRVAMDEGLRVQRRSRRTGGEASLI